MIQAAQDVSLLRSPWTDDLCDLLSSVEEDLLIACPFIKRAGTEHILSQLSRRGLLNETRVGIITDLRPESVLAGSMDLDALTELGGHIPNFHLTHLPGIHAKVYVADVKMAIVTSGNLTHSGLRGNVEYGVALRQEAVVSQIRGDFEGFESLGAGISVEMQDLKKLFSRAQKSIKQQARKLFEDRLEKTHVQLLRRRVAGGTPNSVFADTIKFLLLQGPLRTEQLHPLIQAIHPDLCDDSVDRTIDGVNFGKKWKHQVRTAQQHLKRQGEISFDGERWSLQ
jgi:hypothetical protein